MRFMIVDLSRVIFLCYDSTELWYTCICVCSRPCYVFVCVCEYGMSAMSVV